MNDWTDGQDMLWEYVDEKFIASLPKVDRDDSWWDTHSHRQHKLIKLTRCGVPYAKIFCGDFGYYRVLPTTA